MKFPVFGSLARRFIVTPYGGVWIEMRHSLTSNISFLVTPYGGVWIEMGAITRTLRTWKVTPYGGVWIEMHWDSHLSGNYIRHALWRRVD